MYLYAHALGAFLKNEDGPTVVFYAVMLALIIVLLHRLFYRVG
jgi:Flp pilus assembly pilin Flp